MIRKILISLTVATSVLLMPALASASSGDIHVWGGSAYGPFPFTVSTSSTGQWALDFFRPFPTVNQVCVHLGFSGNLLDPGEQLRVQVAGGTNGKLLTNSTSNSASADFICFTDPADINWWATSRVHGVRAFGVTGSATISSMIGHLYTTE